MHAIVATGGTPDAAFFSVVDIAWFSIVGIFVLLFVIRVILIAKRRGVRGLKESVGRPLVDSATAEYKIYGLPTSTSDDLINQIDKDARDHARGQGIENAKPKP